VDKDFEGEKEMKCLICNEGIAERDFPSHVNIKHDGVVNPWKYIIAIQEKLDEIEANIDKLRGPID
jgi:hypothetical protein